MSGVLQRLRAQVTADLDKLQECQAAAAQRQRALEQQLAQRDAAAAALRSELKATAASAEERGRTVEAQRRQAEVQEAALQDTRRHSQARPPCIVLPHPGRPHLRHRGGSMAREP